MPESSTISIATIPRWDANASFYSLSDGSYQRRAELLIPRAVGYSDGFIEHFFRGKIDATWTQIGVGSLFAYELKITNRSEERIGADAAISAIYRATEGYFDGTSDDAGTILRNAPLAGLVPGFPGLDPGQSVKFVVPSVFGSKEGDSLLGFERRIALRGTLGSEVDGVIGLVQKPVISSAIKIVARSLIGGSVTLGIYDQQDYSTFATCCDWFNSTRIPNTTLTFDPDRNEITFTMDPVNPRVYEGGAAGNDVQVFLDGTLIARYDTFDRDSSSKWIHTIDCRSSPCIIHTYGGTLSMSHMSK